MSSMVDTRSGYIAIVGKPNVGKSTLLNRILDQKLSITSKKPQTTRNQLLGIKTTEAVQFMYVDTPGIHGQTVKALNRYMNRAARSVLMDVDVILLIVDRGEMDDNDALVIEAVKNAGVSLIIVVNKIDRMKDKKKLLPVLQRLSDLLPEAEILPVSAKSGEGIDRLESLVAERLPLAPFYFSDDQMTDRSERFLVAELIREKLMRHLDQELPYELAVEIEKFTDEGHIVHIDALILLERDSQKGIVVGKRGERIKKIASESRVDIEKLLQKKVMLSTWVRTRSGWSDDERILKSLGYDN